MIPYPLRSAIAWPIPLAGANLDQSSCWPAHHAPSGAVVAALVADKPGLEMGLFKRVPNIIASFGPSHLPPDLERKYKQSRSRYAVATYNGGCQCQCPSLLG